MSQAMMRELTMPAGDLGFVVLEHDPFEPAQAHEAGEFAVLDELRSEGIADAHEVPVSAAVAVLDQGLDLVGAQSAIGRRTAPEQLDELDVADAILVLAGGEKGVRHEAQTVAFFRKDSYIVHDDKDDSPGAAPAASASIVPLRGVLTKNRLS